MNTIGNIKKLSVSLPHEHVRFVKRYGARLGIRGFSPALQSIIFQFEKLQKAQASGNGAPLSAVPAPESEAA